MTIAGKPPKRARLPIARAVACAVLAMALALGVQAQQLERLPGAAKGPCADPASKTCAESKARSLLAQGDARVGDGLNRAHLDNALGLWLQSVNEGLNAGAQASLTAQKRIQMYTLTCLFDEPSEIDKIVSHPLVNVKAQQQALTALGDYTGPLNGELSPLMRSAIRRFQRDMAWDATGELKPHQILYLMCNAAETARDPISQTRLGLMYVGGVGVVVNIAYARKFLIDASARNPQATFRLAELHGTGHCGFPKETDKADQWFKDAFVQNQPDALREWPGHQALPPSTRWTTTGPKLITDLRSVLPDSPAPCP